MKFMAREKELENEFWENPGKILEDEARSVYELYSSGSLREIYFDDNNEAVVILECDSREEAEILLDNFPLVKNHMIKFELT